MIDTGMIAVCILLMLFLATVWLILFGHRLGERSSRVSTSAIVLSLIGAVWVLIRVACDGPVSIEAWTVNNNALDWFRWGMYVDRLSATMMVLITGVSTVVHLYSITYLQGDSGYIRFFTLLSGITLVLLAMVSSGNLFMFFVWWQFVSWLLYLLLSYNYKHGPAVQMALKSFLVLRLGDLAFLCGVVLTYKTFGTLQFPELFDRAASSMQTMQMWPGGPEYKCITVITLLLFLSGMTKSAQLPMHGWLPDTMDTPTPVSALMHAGIVNAGGFLINRLAPLYGLCPETLHAVFITGLLTTVIGTGIMLTRTDIKTKLGFSTVGQMGFMMMECGLGAFALAIFHLIAHGIFKATLFLSAGNAIHEIRRKPKSPTVSEPAVFAKAPWMLGVLIELVFPLVILLAAHALLGVQMHQGTIVFIFFAWVTSSQAMLTLYSLRVLGSWKMAGAMILSVILVIVTYLWAVESFTAFLYPNPDQADAYFQAASFPLWAFDLFVGTTIVLSLLGWCSVRTSTQSKMTLRKQWQQALTQLYVLLWNRLYLDRIYGLIRRAVESTARRLDATLPEWIP